MSHTLKHKKPLLNRVRRLRGQLEALERALDEETGCYHAAQVAFNTLMRLYHARKQQGLQGELDREGQLDRELAEAARELRIAIVQQMAEQLMEEFGNGQA